MAAARRVLAAAPPPPLALNERRRRGVGQRRLTARTRHLPSRGASVAPLSPPNACYAATPRSLRAQPSTTLPSDSRSIAVLCAMRIRYHINAQAPCLKFYCSFAIDLLFFLSLTFLSHPKQSQLHSGLLDSIGRQNLIFVHLWWCAGILLNELTQFVSDRSSEFIDLKEDILDAIYAPVTLGGSPRRAVLRRLSMSVVQTLRTFTNIIIEWACNDIIELADLAAPTLAFVALLDDFLNVRIPLHHPPLTTTPPSEVVCLPLSGAPTPSTHPPHTPYHTTARAAGLFGVRRHGGRRRQGRWEGVQASEVRP